MRKSNIGKIALCLAIIIAGFVLLQEVSAKQPVDPSGKSFVSASFDMDKFNRSVVFYQEGVRQYATSHFIGCNYLGLALQESRFVNDNNQTYKKNDSNSLDDFITTGA